MSATLAHQGLPPGIVRKDLLSLVENLGKRGLGISSTAFCVLHHYVFRSRDSDYRQGRICAVWEKVSGTAERLGLCSRGVNEAERELERKGLLVRTTGGNGARSGMRAGESIRWAAGINLAPLIGRFTELQLIRDAQLLHQQAVIETKADIRRIRRKIRETQNPDLHQKSEDILPSGRVAPIADLPRLQAILTALEAVFESLSDESGRQISSDAPEEMFRPNIQNNRSRTCTSNREGAVTPEIALELASPAYRELVATKGGATWPNLVETSRQMVGAIGISQGAWGKACDQLGRERAAICVLVIERNSGLQRGHRFRARHPGRCLSGMVRRAADEGFNLPGLLRSVRRGECPSGAGQPPIDGHALSERSSESAAGIGDLVANILRRSANSMGGQS